jgi:hypothetical protein
LAAVTFVTKHSGYYASVVKLTKAYFDRKGRRVSEKLFSKIALRVYNVTCGEVTWGRWARWDFKDS